MCNACLAITTSEALSGVKVALFGNNLLQLLNNLSRVSYIAFFAKGNVKKSEYAKITKIEEKNLHTFSTTWLMNQGNTFFPENTNSEKPQESGQIDPPSLLRVKGDQKVKQNKLSFSYLGRAI